MANDFDFCISEAVSSGKLTKALARQLSEAENKDALIDDVLSNLSRQKKEAAYSAIAMDSAWKNIEQYKGSKFDALRGLLTRDPKGKAGYKNVQFRAKYYEGKYHARLAELFSRFRTRMLGLSQDKRGLNDFVKALYGEAVEDAQLSKFAKEFAELAEDMRTNFNRAGGSISKNQNWKMPPPGHDMKAIHLAGKDPWKEFIIPRLDRSLMVDDYGKPLDDKQLDQALDYVYETITTSGLNKAKDFSAPRLGTKLSSRGGEQRFLYFKDADSWLKYNERFGKGDVFTTFTDHINGMAHNTALMDVMGPNPENTYKALKAMLEKEKALSNVEKAQLDAIFNVVSGKTNSGELVGLSDFMQGTSNLVTAGILGSAFLSAVSDAGFNVLTSQWNGFSPIKSIVRQMKMMSPGSEDARVFGVRLGLTADNMIDMAHAGNRFADTYGTGKTAKISEVVMRGSLLSPWTESGRKGFGLEFSASLADDFGKTFDQLSDTRKKRFASNGITAEDWDLFRKQSPLEFKGAKYADLTQDGGEKFHQMVMQETDFAIPVGDANVQAITTGGLGRGTASGQGVRAVMKLKTFPLTLLYTHLQRAAYQTTGAEKVQYLAALFVYTTVLGGIALQAKDLASGREPRPVNKEFILAAVQQGGGLGIFGDFLFSDVNRFGGGLTETIIGPYGGLIDQSTKLTLGNIHEALRGDETNVLGESAQFLKRWSPDVWQTRLFTDAVFDQFDLLVNPDAQKRFNRIIRRRQTEYNQGYWWRPGDSAPEALK